MHDTFRQQNYGCMFPGSPCHTWAVRNGNILYSIFLLLVGMDATHSFFVYVIFLKCKLMNCLCVLYNKFHVMWKQTCDCKFAYHLEETNGRSLVKTTEFPC